MRYSLHLLTALLLSVACGNDAAPDASAPPGASPGTPATAPAAPDPDAPLYAWVDDLNVREAPNGSAAVVAKVGPDTPLRPTGALGDATEAVVLRGGLYEAPWREVTLPDGGTGWVFGGAVQPRGGAERTPPQRAGVLDFEHFGRFDLSQWRTAGPEDVSVPEVDAELTTYRKADRRLEVEHTSMGEFRYGERQTLRDGTGEPLRHREFSWAVDQEGNHVEETVIDYEASPPRAYRRTQNPVTHFHSFSPPPTRAVGAWDEIAVAEAEAALHLEGFGASAGQADRAGVMGRWRSKDDPRSVLSIDEDRFRYVYDGDDSEAPQPYVRTDRCPEDYGGRGAGNVEDGAYFVIGGGDRGRCLYLVRVGERELVFSNVGRGNYLTYERL